MFGSLQHALRFTPSSCAIQHVEKLKQVSIVIVIVIGSSNSNSDRSSDGVMASNLLISMMGTH